jgi:3-dehydroquinate dehydratase I
LTQPRICVSIMERTIGRTARSVRLLDRHDPDLIEIRFDSMKPAASFSEIRDATERPLIATNRNRTQGGRFSGNERTRIDLLLQAIREGFDYVDVELTARDAHKLTRQAREDGAEVIISYHNQKSTPTESKLKSILAREEQAGADVCKIVCTAKSHADNLRCLRFVEKYARETRLVCFCMGKAGIPSRILSPILGGYFTFASFRTGRETAPGQIPIDDLKALYKELGVV